MFSDPLHNYFKIHQIDVIKELLNVDSEEDMYIGIPGVKIIEENNLVGK